ncbi:MAG: RNA-binding S4 domain-containing protein [Proteobacteria bacterium]|nr:RNA-binding S4 domain-containing protein [Pseudomonadota bacterium]
MRQEFAIEETGITLTQALKFYGVSESGGKGKALISEGKVRVNSEVEYRKRRQLTAGDIILVDSVGEGGKISKYSVMNAT